jgi:hypothetical protein
LLLHHPHPYHCSIVMVTVIISSQLWSQSLHHCSCGHHVITLLHCCIVVVTVIVLHHHSCRSLCCHSHCSYCIVTIIVVITLSPLLHYCIVTVITLSQLQVIMWLCGHHSYHIVTIIVSLWSWSLCHCGYCIITSLWVK